MRTNKKAQSEVVGLVLIFGTTFLAISIILLTGLPTLDDARENMQVERLQAEFQKLDSELRNSIYGTGQSDITLNIDDGGISVDDGTESMSLIITHVNETTSPPTTTSTGEIELGSISYETGGSGVAYQMGGVWSNYENGGVALRSPPDMEYSGRSLSLNLINFTDNVEVAGTGSSNFLLRSEGVRRNSDLVNLTEDSLADGELRINVSTSMDNIDDAWAEYFNRTFGEKNVDGSDDGWANASVQTGPPLFGVEYLGGRYDEAFTPPGSLCPGNPICIVGDDEINVTDYRIGDESDYVRYVDSDTIVPSSIPLPVTKSDIDSCIRNRGGPDPSSNTVESGVYSSSDFDLPNKHGTFDASTGPILYYVDGNVDTDGIINFDTSGGRVEVYVDGRFKMGPGTEISVNGSNPVRFYSNRMANVEPSSVQLQDGRTELFQVYTSQSGGNIQVTRNYNGTIYAPEAKIIIDSTFRGAAIANNSGDPVTVNGEYFHDAALRQADIPDCINPPLTKLNAVERLVSVR
jgi:hypothetical protein